MFWRSASLIAVSSVLAVLATIAVIFRFLARRLKGLRVWADDYFVFVALVLTWGVCICNIVGAAIGRFGNHEIFQTSGPQKGHALPELMMVYGKVCFACRLLHATAMQVLKLSLLLFFRRMFEQSRRFNLVFCIMTGYVVLWWLVCFWLNVFTCYPIPWSWSFVPTMAQHCIPNYHSFFAYAALTNVVSDVAIAIVPFPFLLQLRMSRRKKLAIAGMLLTGAVVIIAATGRTIAFFTVGHSLDYTYENYYYLIWSSIEPCVGVIGSCLPTFRPLFTHTHTSAYSKDYAASTRRVSSAEGALPLRADGLDEKHTHAPFAHDGTFLRPTTSGSADDDTGAGFRAMNPTPPLEPLVGRTSPV